MKESLEKAKEAVSLDVKDGLSWSKIMIQFAFFSISTSVSSCFHPVVLGNAYLSVFFATNQDSKMLQLCANAYGQAVSSDTYSLFEFSFAPGN